MRRFERFIRSGKHEKLGGKNLDRDDLGVLQLARAFEQATGFWKQRPPVADGRG